MAEGRDIETQNDRIYTEPKPHIDTILTHLTKPLKRNFGGTE